MRPDFWPLASAFQVTLLDMIQICTMISSTLLLDSETQSQSCLYKKSLKQIMGHSWQTMCLSNDCTMRLV